MSLPRWTCASKMSGFSGSSRRSSCSQASISFWACASASSTTSELIDAFAADAAPRDTIRADERRPDRRRLAPEPRDPARGAGRGSGSVPLRRARRLPRRRGRQLRGAAGGGGRRRARGVRVCAELGVESAVVPPDFPLEIADRLRESGVEVKWDRPFFIARRRVKNEEELAGIKRAQRACEAAMDEARRLLRQADRSNGVLQVDGEPLTSERLKSAVERVFSDHGVSSEDLIVSHGPQTAIGHDSGSGPIAPGEPIVLDLFPRDRATGCYAEMTRTFVVGTPPDELAEYARLVQDALERSLAEIRAGASGRHVYDVACDVFEQHGFGGCRLEDLVLVTADGAENLTDYPYDLSP